MDPNINEKLVMQFYTKPFNYDNTLDFPKRFVPFLLFGKSILAVVC